MGTKNKSSGSQHNPRGVAQGVTLVCHKTGLPVDCVVDSNGVRRLAVDANVSIDTVQLAVDLDHCDDSVSIGDCTTGALLKVETDGSINVNIKSDAKDGDNIAISAHPAANQLFDESADTITTAAFEETYSFTSASNNTRLLAIECTANTPATFRLKIDGTLKRELRSSPGKRNVTFEFREHRTLLSGEVLTVETRVEKLVRAVPFVYRTFTSLEGYLCS